MQLCVKRKNKQRKKRENNTFYYFISGLYYFMELHEKITTVNWTEKIDKLVFEDAKYIYIYFFCIPGC